MQQAAAQAYAQTAQQTVSPRNLEADLLTKAAAKLEAMIERNAVPRDEWIETLRYNRRLWTVFTTAVTELDHPMPTEVRTNIANLGVFVFKQTVDAEVKRTAQTVRPLITINREIAAGLRGAGA
ncbi:MAG: flagellar biosynthesis regulator FlaF [Pseudomonadota bacterium]